MNAAELKIFIKNHVIKRQKSFLWQDLKDHESQIKETYSQSRVLVIGGAGTIGSNFINAILQYDIEELVVVDLNENGLTELVRNIRSHPTLKAPKVLTTYPVDFGSELFLRWYLKHDQFDIVANFAALKACAIRERCF